MEGTDGPKGASKIQDVAPASKTPSGSPSLPVTVGYTQKGKPKGGPLAPLPFEERVAGFTQTQTPGPTENGWDTNAWVVEKGQLQEIMGTVGEGLRGWKGLGRDVSKLLLTLPPGSPWTPGDPDSPGSPCKENAVKILLPPKNPDSPHTSFSFDPQL